MKIAWAGHALAALALSAAIMQVACGGGSPQNGSNNTSSTNGGTNSTPPTPSLRITTVSLPNALQGQPYSQALQASGGTPPYAWSTSTNYFPCPAGLSLSAAGLLSGTPTNWGNEACFVQVTDSSSPPQTASQVVNFFIIQALSIAAPMSTTPPSVRHPFSELFLANGGSPPYSWSLQSGSLPPGLTLVPGSSDAAISGTPTARGIYNFTLQVSDSGPPQQTTTQSVSLTVFDYPEITNNTLPVGLIDYPYNAQLQAIGGTPPYSWSAPRLPGGLQLNSSSGMLTGAPIVQWYQPTSFTVIDSSVPPLQSTSNLFLDINTPLVFTQSQSALSDAVQGQPYAYPLPFEGGLPPFVLSITNGSLPSGISAPQTGGNGASFSGSPSANGTSNFTLTVQDSESPNPAVIQQSFSIRVNPQLVLTSAQLPPGAVGLPYLFQLQVSGGLPPYIWTDRLAPGLSIDSTGLVSGIPGSSGYFEIIISVRDSANPPQTAVLIGQQLRIYDQLKITTSVVPPIAPNVGVNMQLGGFGGTGNSVWSLASGSLPSGLNLSPAGQLSGAATQTGSFPFTLQLSDAGPPAQTATLATTLTVNSALGRNDSPATATPLSNGTYQASISPFSDPPTGVANPDSDYYVLTANPSATVTIEIKAQRLTPASPLDSVLEIVDVNNNRLSFCNNPPIYSFTYNNPCLNDDLPDGSSTDSILTLQVPNSGPLTFYAHVLDWRGDARPDFIYTITVTGAN